MIEYLEYEGESYPYKVGYKVFKAFQEEKKLSPTQFAAMGMEDMVYLHYLAFKAGHSDKNIKKKLPWKTFAQFEDFIDDDFSLFKRLEDIFVKFMPDEDEDVTEGK